MPAAKRVHAAYNFDLLTDRDIEQKLLFDEKQLEQLYKAGNIEGFPLQTQLRLAFKKFMIDLAWASSALEGNTYNYIDTEVLLTYGQVPEGKTDAETTMILNHKRAIEYVLDGLDQIQVNARTIKDIHALLSAGLIRSGQEGKIRERSVAIGGSAYRPLDVNSILNEQLLLLVDRYHSIEDPFNQSLFCLLMIAYLQPFDDVNKSTSRLTANIPLLKNHLAPLSFVEVDKRQYVEGLLSFYELNRTEEMKGCFLFGYLDSAKGAEAIFITL